MLALKTCPIQHMQPRLQEKTIEKENCMMILRLTSLFSLSRILLLRYQPYGLLPFTPTLFTLSSPVRLPISALTPFFWAANIDRSLQGKGWSSGVHISLIFFQSRSIYFPNSNDLRLMTVIMITHAIVGWKLLFVSFDDVC